MSRRFFGTDGVRGRVGQEPITPDWVMRLGYSAGQVLAERAAALKMGHDRPTVLIGKDTRISGYMLESALEAGLIAAGVDTLLVGPMTTPGVAYLTRALRLQAGIVISASHNPYHDNGIKFFSATGHKLSDDIEREIEARMDLPMQVKDSAELGKARRVDDASGRYIEFCKSTFPNELDLRGLKVVVDCAHGAAYQVAPHVLHELGADVVAMGNMPNGLNINAGVGATQPQALVAAVGQHSADFGIALDGDGDRLIMVDADGQIYDGDQLLYVIARYRQQENRLQGGVVGTQMTNLGIEQALLRHQIPFYRAKVGDRYVLEALQQHGWILGGESSGHLVCLDKHTTGDGLISALQVLHALQAQQLTLGQACADVALMPQVLINVPVPKSFDFRQSLPLQAALVEAECNLGRHGRILLRPSGTEPVLRVMVEGAPADLIQSTAEHMAALVAQFAAAG